MSILSKSLIKGVLPLVSEHLDTLINFLVENLQSASIENSGRAVYMLFLNEKKGEDTKNVYVCSAILDGNDKITEIKDTKLAKDFITDLISMV